MIVAYVFSRGMVICRPTCAQGMVIFLGYSLGYRCKGEMVIVSCTCSQGMVTCRSICSRYGDM